jgi:hypothetical protein
MAEHSVPTPLPAKDSSVLPEIDEKALSSDVNSVPETPPNHDWTEEEEKAVVKKIDFLVMPLLMLAFFALQLDRGNM